MAFTTGQTATQLAAALVTAGASTDAANNAVWSLAWGTNGSVVSGSQSAVLWGVLCKCTSPATVAGGAPVFAYDATPT